MAFSHLHVHSEYSPKDSIAKVPAIVAKIARDGQGAVAVTDHGSLGGMWALHNAAREHGIKPIPGFEAYLALSPNGESRTEHIVERAATGETATDGGSEGKEVRYHHLTVLAATRTGWHNLLRLHNDGYDDLWYTPRIDVTMLKRPTADMKPAHRVGCYGEGILVLTGCLGGPLQRPLQQAVLAERAADAADATGDDLGAQAHRSRAEAHAATARTNVERLIDAVGAENVYVEVMFHGIDGELEILEKLYELADAYGLKCVATGDSHCVEAHDEAAQDAWLAIGSKKLYSDPKRWRFSGTGYHVKTEAEMRAVFPDDPRWQEACSNTALVADRVEDDVIPDPQMRLPKFPTPDGSTADEYLRRLTYDGARERYGAELPQHVVDRLEHELQVIGDKGFADYFLIEWDTISWCRSDYTAEDWVARLAGRDVDDATRERKKPISVGPGRGSAAGSAVSYCLGIVGVDPIDARLLFERFLAPDRTGMPDIDVDFEFLRRAEVHHFLQIRWGVNAVAQIGTYVVGLSKGALKAAARTLDMVGAAEKLAKLVPMKGVKPMPFDAFTQPDSPVGHDFREALAAYGDEGRSLLALARAIEGVKSAESVHACGILVSADDLRDIVPMLKKAGSGSSGMWVTRWEGPELEEFGMLKMDVLGLRNLDIAEYCLGLIRDGGEDVDLEGVDETAIDDARVAATWQMLADGRTAGVFQLESAGMTRLLTTAIGAMLSRGEAPTLEDLSTVIALYRPGPMGEGMHDLWAEIKAARAHKSYGQFTAVPAEQDVIASVLDDTEGVIVLQEQLMSLAQSIAGFGPYTKSKLQKAVSKKRQKDLDLLEPLFIHGGVFTAPDGSEEAVPGGTAEFTRPDGSTSPAFAEPTLHALWQTFKASGEYLFNKAHSFAYGQLAFWTAYLKANWPLEYGAALLVRTDKAEARRAMLSELARHGVDVLPPVINLARASTHVHTDSNGGQRRIVFGLAEVKGVSRAAAELIVHERDAGPFESFEDATTRLLAGSITMPDGAVKRVSTAELEHLVIAGAFDEFGARLPMVRLVRGLSAPARSGATAPSFPPLAEQDPRDWSPVERAARQADLLRVSLGEHPMATREVADILGTWSPSGEVRNVNVQRLSAAVSYADQAARPFFAGILSSWRVVSRETGDFAFGVIEDAEHSLEIAVWARALRALRARGEDALPRVGDLVVVTGRVEQRRRHTIVSSGDSDVDADTASEESGAEKVFEEIVDIQVLADDLFVVTGQSRRVEQPVFAAPVAWSTVIEGVDQVLRERKRPSRKAASSKPRTKQSSGGGELGSSPPTGDTATLGSEASGPSLGESVEALFAVPAVDRVPADAPVDGHGGGTADAPAPGGFGTGVGDSPAHPSVSSTTRAPQPGAQPSFADLVYALIPPG